MSIELGNGTQYYWGDDFLQIISGQNGEDFLAEDGWANFVDGGNGMDEILSFGMTNVLYGNNGDDYMGAGMENSPVVGNSLFGGRGDDFMIAMGTLSALHGEAGNDLLVMVGSRNAIDGGKGDDGLASISSGGTYSVGMGNAMAGGTGVDMFYLENASDLRVLNDDGASDVIDENDSIVGVIDVISDYVPGELIDIWGVQEVTSPVGVSVGHPLLGDGEYTFVRGDLARSGHFDVAAAGEDLLLIYDRGDGNDQVHLQGAVVLIGVTDPAAVTIGDFLA